MFKFIWLIRDRAYWRQRAESLEAKLETERIANRRFEREMISRIVTMVGQMGIESPRPSKTTKTPSIKIPPQPTETVIQNFSPEQAESWKMYEEDAAANGISQNTAWKDFFQREILPRIDIADDMEQ